MLFDKKIQFLNKISKCFFFYNYPEEIEFGRYVPLILYADGIITYLLVRIQYNLEILYNNKMCHIFIIFLFFNTYYNYYRIGRLQNLLSTNCSHTQVREIVNDKIISQYIIIIRIDTGQRDNIIILLTIFFFFVIVVRGSYE